LLTALGLIFLLSHEPPLVRGADPQPPTATGREFEQWRILNTIFEVATVKEPVHMILVNKARRNLQVLKHDGRLQLVEEYPCTTDANTGTKSKRCCLSYTPEACLRLHKNL
jgi:hypothetical protein